MCADLALTEGRSAAIAAFRRTLQAARLGIPAPAAPPALPASSWVRLGDGVDACHEIRETLRSGGLGRIERLAPPEPPGRPSAPGPADAVDPESETFDLAALIPLLLLAGTRPRAITSRSTTVSVSTVNPSARRPVAGGRPRSSPAPPAGVERRGRQPGAGDGASRRG